MGELVPEQVIEKFQKRRRRMLQSFGLCMLLIAVALCVRQVADVYPVFLGISRNGWLVFAISQLTAGIVIGLTGFLQYRCPVCNQIARAHDRYYLGVAMDPQKCPNCGSRLNHE